MDTDALPQSIRHLFNETRCVRCNQFYFEGLQAGKWSCAMHVGEFVDYKWTCCGGRVSLARGCVPCDHGFHREVVREYCVELFKFVEPNLDARGSRVRGPDPDALYVNVVDPEALRRAQSSMYDREISDIYSYLNRNRCG